MKLGAEQLRSAAAGAAECREEDGILRFSKVTAEQTEAWRRAMEWIVPNALATTGIRLDFHTDSPFVRIETAGGAKFEILTDGLLTAQFRPVEGDRILESALPEGEHRVTVVYPSHGEPGVIRSVELADGSSFASHRTKEKLLFLGDSITQGWNSVYDSLSFAWQVTLARDADSVIQGIGGPVFLPDSVTDFGYRPDTVVAAWGTNDFGFYRTLGELEERAEETFTRIRTIYAGARILAVTPTWRRDEGMDRAMGSFAACRETVKKAAERTGTEVLDGYVLYPHRDEFMADDVHPNDLGFSQYAAHLTEALRAGKETIC